MTILNFSRACSQDAVLVLLQGDLRGLDGVLGLDLQRQAIGNQDVLLELLVRQRRRIELDQHLLGVDVLLG